MNTNHNIPNPDAFQFIQLTPEQAEIMRTAPETIQHLGHSAMEGVKVVGIVVGEEAQPYFMTVDTHDPGTRISVEPGRTAAAENNLRELGNPEDRLAELHAAELASQTEKEEVDSPSIESLLQDSQLVELVARYQTIESFIHQSVTHERYSIDTVVQELQVLLGNLRSVSEQGPWSGNYMSGHPELIMRMRVLEDNVRGQIGFLGTSGEDRLNESRVFKNQFTEASEDVARTLNELEADEAGQIRSATYTITDELGVLTNRISDINESSSGALRTLASTLENAIYDTHQSVDDVMTQLYRIQQTLGDVYSDSLQVTNANEAVAQGIAALKNQLQ